ncbi:MAG: hypothetical protein OEV31_03020, partial [Gammaproteobacteria bacterium]|nr:hypothetical protein [Gammaproteobacteria bacterium]
MELVTRPATAFQIEDSEPLYKRAPARDAAGRPVGDFMVLIPGLRERSRQEFSEVVARLQAVLAGFREVVFVDLN